VLKNSRFFGKEVVERLLMFQVVGAGAIYLRQRDRWELLSEFLWGFPLLKSEERRSAWSM
jgi:hypothetical protein